MCLSKVQLQEVEVEAVVDQDADNVELLVALPKDMVNNADMGA